MDARAPLLPATGPVPVRPVCQGRAVCCRLQVPHLLLTVLLLRRAQQHCCYKHKGTDVHFLQTLCPAWSSPFCRHYNIGGARWRCLTCPDVPADIWSAVQVHCCGLLWRSRLVAYICDQAGSGRIKRCLSLSITGPLVRAADTSTAWRAVYSPARREVVLLQTIMGAGLRSTRQRTCGLHGISQQAIFPVVLSPTWHRYTNIAPSVGRFKAYTTTTPSWPHASSCTTSIMSRM